MDGRVEKGLETKNRIIKASLELISREGIKSLSANKIAKLAGVSKSNVFHHFGSVDVIPIKALEYLIESMMQSIEGPMKGSLKEALISIGEYTFSCEDNEMYMAMFALYNESFYDERYKKVVNEMKDAYTEEMYKLIKYYHPNIEDDGELMILSKMITIALDGLGYHFMTDNAPDMFLPMWRMQVDMIIEYVNKKDI